MYSLHVHVDRRNQLGGVTVLQTSIQSDGTISDDHAPVRRAVSPSFLHALLSARLSYADDYLDHTAGGTQDWLGGSVVRSNFHGRGVPGWLTHKTSEEDSPTYRFKLEEIDLTGKSMKSTMYFSTGEAKNGVLPSGAKLADAFGDAKFSAGAIGLQIHMVIPENMSLYNHDIFVSHEKSSNLICPWTISNSLRIGLKLSDNGKVEVYNVSNTECKIAGSMLGEGQYSQTKTKGVFDTWDTNYFFTLPTSLNIESQLFNSTYVKAGAKLAVTIIGNIGGPHAGAYFDKETKLVDPQIHFNKAAISELKVQLAL